MKKFLICLNFLLIFSYSNASTLSFKKIVNLNEPWGSTFLNDHELLITEKSGEIKLVNLKTKNITKINHNLEVTPELIIAKGANRPGRDWVVYNSSDGLSATHYIPEHGVTLNGNMWNNTNPTATTFSVSNSSYINQSGYNYIAYLFASLPGVSKVGTYSGSTSNNVDVDCGFTAGVRFVLVHRIDTGMDYRQWYVWDSARGIVSGNDPFSYFNIAQRQVTNYDYIDPLSSGFTITSSAPADLNATGGTYLFLAIA